MFGTVRFSSLAARLRVMVGPRKWVFAAAAVILPGTLVSMGTVAAAVPPTSRPPVIARFLMNSASPGLTLVSQSPVAPGFAATEWSMNGSLISAAGPVNSTVSVSATASTSGGQESVSVVPPVDTTNNVEASVAAYQESGVTVAGLLTAIGAPPAIANQISDAMSTATLSASGAAVSPAYFNATCDGWDGAPWGGGTSVYVYGCLTQTLAQAGSTNDWIEDTISNSGFPYNCGVVVLDSNDYYNYTGSSGNHQIVQWSPESTISQGLPTTVTASIAYNGIGVSVSAYVYPSHLSPDLVYWNGSAYTGFGSNWGGPDTNDVQATPSADLEHTTNSGTNDAGVQNAASWSCPD